ncbi:hypothetical protein B9Z55_024876 [Caenorhabditis nigoni]|nr:hypothetical protein B9Z55_024876 [Caenorhabditis nigoni]
MDIQSRMIVGLKTRHRTPRATNYSGDADDGQIVKKDERGQSRSNQVVPTVAAKVFDYVHILSDVEITVQSILPAHEPDGTQLLTGIRGNSALLLLRTQFDIFQMTIMEIPSFQF